MKKGFTLAELLGVLVILGLIAIITFPAISKSFYNSKVRLCESQLKEIESAARAFGVDNILLLPTGEGEKYIVTLKDLSDKGYIDSNIENPLTNKKFNKNTTKVEITRVGKKYTYKIDEQTRLSCDSSSSNSGSSSQSNAPKYTVTYNANGGTGTMNTTENSVVSNTFTAPDGKTFKEWNTKSDGTGTTYTTASAVSSNLTLYAIWVKTYTVGEAINYNPETNELCESPVSTPGTKTGCMKWYVIKDNGNSVDVILDHNTTAKVVYNTTTPYVPYEQASIKTQVDTDTASWTSGLNPRLITAYEIANVTNTTTFDGTYGRWFYLNGSGDKKHTRVSTSQGTNEYAWLFDYTHECTSYGCQIADSSTFGYWTSSPVDGVDSYAWYVVSSGGLTNYSVDEYAYGVRPVITISKTSING